MCNIVEYGEKKFSEFAVVVVFFFQSRSRFELLGRLNKKDPDEKLVTSAKESLSTAVSQIADYFLKDRSYICGDSISVADLIGVCVLLQLGSVNESDIYEKNTTITK